MAPKKSVIKKSGSYKGKSNTLGHGGRSAQLRSILGKKGLPETEISGIIGKQARANKTAPGMKNNHSKKKGKK